MKKIYKKLTENQIKRGVVFSSCLSEQRTEQTNDTIHEVLATNEEREEKIKRLKNDKVFNESHWKYNIIRL